MATRREVIRCLATCAGVSAVFSTAVSLSAPVPVMRYNKLLYDDRFAAGLAFAAEASRLGADVHAVRGDVTGIWLAELQPQWKAALSPTAGLTDFNSWFVLDMMARDAGMRTVFLGHHEATQRGTTHHLFGPHAVINTLLHSRPLQWGTQTAGVVMRFPPNVSVTRHQSTMLEARNREISRTSLVSWIIARPAPVRA